MDGNDYWLKVAGAGAGQGVSEPQTCLPVLNAAYHPLLEEQLPKINGWTELKRQAFLDKKNHPVFRIARPAGCLQRGHWRPVTHAFSRWWALVLLIACTNVAKPAVGQRAAARQREFAIRESARKRAAEESFGKLLVESLFMRVRRRFTGRGFSARG